MELCNYPCSHRVCVFDIEAIQIPIVYNRYGDHDPDGLLFVPLEEVEAAQSGKHPYKPLILRANAGDWVEVTLHNMLDENRPIPYFDYPTVPLEKETVYAGVLESAVLTI